MQQQAFDLVFEGGGAKGAVFVGALEVMESNGVTARRTVGTSAGAITATLLAAGYTAQEMRAVTDERLPNGKPRFSSFMDIPERFAPEVIEDSLTFGLFRAVDIPFIPEWIEEKLDHRIFNLMLELDAYREIFSFVERGGLYAGNTFLEWLKEKLAAKGEGLAHATFATFHQHTGKDLSMVVTDTEAGRLLVLNHRTAPDCPVAWGVRMSMSIPFIWQEVIWQSEWGTYRGEDISGHSMVDGGVLSNFPLALVTSKSETVRAVMGDEDPDAVPNIGFLIAEELEVKNAPAPEEEAAGEDGGVLQNVTRLRTVRRTRKLMNAMMAAHDKRVINANPEEICRLPAQGYGTTEFDMSAERLKALIEAGAAATHDYLVQRFGNDQVVSLV